MICKNPGGGTPPPLISLRGGEWTANPPLKPPMILYYLFFGRYRLTKKILEFSEAAMGKARSVQVMKTMLNFEQHFIEKNRDFSTVDDQERFI